MKPEEQRIAIAEWCGLRDIQNAYCYGRDGSLPLPDYLNDLNAMWQAEEKLHGLDWARYFNRIQANGNGSGVHATAAQRAEALLRTIGKWKE